MAYTPCYPDRINWQNEPSEATALNDVNLNKMDSAIYTIDGRVVDMSTRLDTDDTEITNLQGDVSDLQGDMSDAQDDITDLQSGKVDKETGKDLSTNDFTNAYKTKLDTIPANANHVEIEQVVTEGTTLANITIDGTTTAIKGSDIEVDEELSPTSTNPVENKAIYDALNNLLPSKTVSGNPISISDASGFNAKALTVTMNPIQDLNGYEYPWVGGTGKNKAKVTLSSGTYYNIPFTVDDFGRITTNGVPSSAVAFPVAEVNLVGGTSYILSGGVDGDYRLYIQVDGTPYTSGSTESSIFTPTTSGKYDINIVVTTGASVGDTASPMIRLSSVTDATFAPYENICPISGRTQTEVGRTNENLLAFGTQLNGFASTSDSKFHTQPNSVGYYFLTKSLPNTITFTGTGANRAYISYYSTAPADNVSYELIDQTSATTPRTITVNKNYKYIHIQLSYNASVTDIMVNEGSSIKPYVAPQGQKITIQFGQTVYGGSLDLNSGLLTIDTKYEVFNGQEQNWTTRTSGALRLFERQISENIPSSSAQVGKCNELKWNLNLSELYTYRLLVTTLSISMPTTMTQVSDFATWLSSNNLEVAYPLATPITIQLSPEALTLLKGNNVLSTNADDMELKYSVSLDSLLPTTTRTLAKSPIVEEPKEETDETEEQR